MKQNNKQGPQQVASIDALDALRPIRELYPLFPYAASTMQRLVAQKRIPTHVINGRHYATRREVEQFLQIRKSNS